MDFRFDHFFKDNQDIILQVSENQTAEQLAENRRGVGIYITALMRTVNSMSATCEGNEMMVTIKIITSLAEASDLYVMYTRALQHKR